MHGRHERLLCQYPIQTRVRRSQETGHAASGKRTNDMQWLPETWIVVLIFFAVAPVIIIRTFPRGAMAPINTQDKQRRQ